MVVIRLARGGAKKNPYYRVIVADHKFKNTGRFIEKIGFYNPSARGNEEKIRLDQARIDFWVSQGAQLSPRVKHIIKEAV